MNDTYIIVITLGAIVAIFVAIVLLMPRIFGVTPPPETADKPHETELAPPAATTVSTSPDPATVAPPPTRRPEEVSKTY